jgi:ubiquinone/menaquinone biosynthesis C-methylase UbiE
MRRTPQDEGRFPFSVSFKNYAGGAAANYERYFVPAIGTPFATDLVEVAAVQPAERVLDVACGTGVVARLAAERVGPAGVVAGLDLNPGMLAVAGSVTPPGTAIAWHEASAEAIPLPDQTFDVVLCSLGMQFFRDRLRALHEMHRVLRPRGRIAFNGVGPTPQLFSIFQEALARHVSLQAAGFVGQVFSLYDPRELQGLLEAAGFRDVDVLARSVKLVLPETTEFLWQYVHSTPLVGALQYTDDHVLAALERDVVAGWQTLAGDGSMILDQEVVVATGRSE